jgi:hypothetical protein
MPKKIAKKAGKKTRQAKPKTKAKTKKGDAYQCSVCGYRIIVDEACGCAEEHIFICCDKPMKKKAKKKAA